MAAPDARHLSAEEYATWLTPREALDSLPSWPYETKVRTIANSLLDGLIRSVAEVAVAEGGAEPISLIVLPRSIWNSWACLADPDFWNAGGREIYSTNTMYPSRTVRLYRIRLDPDGVTALRPDRPASPTLALPLGANVRNSPAPLPPKIERAQLREWVRGFASRNPGSPFSVILQNAKLAFPQFRVGERPVKSVIADLNLTLSQGNPTILRK